MASGQEFEVTVHTSPGPTCGTFNRLWLSLIGSQGETPPVEVNEGEHHLLSGSVCPVRVQANGPLGCVVLVRLRLEAQVGLPNLNWHCSRVEVRRIAGEWAPEDPDVQVFLGDRWLQTADGDVELRSGKLCLLQDETEEKLKQQRVKELQLQQRLIRWRQFVDGAPQCIDLSSASDLGPNLSYKHKSPSTNTHYLKGLDGRAEAWTSLQEFETVFLQNSRQNSIASKKPHHREATVRLTNGNAVDVLSISGFIRAHWTEDWYFGHQCLNGCNPLLLRQIHALPPNLPVTSDLLRPFLPEGSSIDLELQKGNLYLLDYEVLDGIPANVINGKQSYLSAPLCLLHLNQQGQLVPIAIQLQQTPGPQNPVFLPSDSGCDWLLAKMWVHGADFQCHQLVSHYLRTHMMAELVCVATLRQLPPVHPLHQLLMPHVRTSLQINHGARASLLAPNGVFDKAVGCGLEALPVLLSRSSRRISYRSMCVPDDVRDRGVDKLPQSYYSQDALRVWTALHRFALRWVDLYYSGDDVVQQDSELQQWIAELHAHGFVHSTGFPQVFHTKAEVTKFVTMVIFSCSALHAAVNFSQLDFALWLPNCPMSMLRPPPQVKGSVTEDDITSFLPDVNVSCRVLASLSLLSQPAVDFVPLCHYREPVFGNDVHRRLLQEVQAELDAISSDIAKRNSHLELPYPYLSPTHIDNSVAI